MTLGKDTVTGRRQVMALVGSCAMLSPLLSLLNFVDADAEQSSSPSLDVNDPAARAMGYVADARDADIERFPKRAGISGAGQSCKTCQFFTQIESDTGVCSLFNGRGVNGGGWCNGWAKKSG